MTETESLRCALASLGRTADDVETLIEQRGRRCVVRADEIIIKAFSSGESAAFEREVAGFRALAQTGLCPGIVAAGDLWMATENLPGQPPLVSARNNRAIHFELGRLLVQLHSLPPAGLGAWPIAERLQFHFARPPAACPRPLVEGVARLLTPWLATMSETVFVHGDWGTSNILLGADGDERILAIVDFEDAHLGDPAEDFRWQLLGGMQSEEYLAMAESYVEAGGRLGERAVHRLAVPAAELCFDMLGWSIPDSEKECCITTLEELARGILPQWPGQ